MTKLLIHLLQWNLPWSRLWVAFEGQKSPSLQLDTCVSVPSDKAGSAGMKVSPYPLQPHTSLELLCTHECNG